MGNLLNPYRYAAGGSYQSALEGQGWTNYWSLQTARSVTDTEPDLIGSKDMTMASGNVPVSSNDGPFGTDDDAVTFASADTEYMENATTYDPDQDWSLSMWIKSSGNQPTNHILWSWSDKDGDEYLYLLQANSASAVAIQIGTAAIGAKFIYWDSGKLDLDLDTDWHHIVITRDYDAVADDDTWKYYVDGDLKATRSRTTLGHGADITALGGWAIGNRNVNSSIGFDGDIAHVSFADGVVVSAAEVSALYAFGV